MVERKCKRVIAVLGMHRSGTSAITRGLQALGVSLGDDLMPPFTENEKGFFEDIGINKLNIEILNALSSDWHALSNISETSFNGQDLVSFKLRGIDLLRTKVGDQPFGLKDPRMSRLLPFWQSVFNHLGVRHDYIIAVRHPMSVVKSLHHRNGFDDEKGYYLWLQHVIPAIVKTGGTSRLVVDFDLLMTNPKKQLERIAKTLDLNYIPDLAIITEYIDEFLEARLRHFQFKFEDLLIDHAVPSDVITTYEILSRLARDEMNIDDHKINETLIHVSSRLKDLSPAFDYITRSDRILNERDVFKQHAAKLSDVLAVRESEIANLKQHATNLSDVVAARESEITNLKRHAANLGTILSAKDKDILLLLAQKQELIEKVNRTAERSRYLEEQLYNAEIKIAELLSSKSWRVTKPLRVVTRIIRKSKKQKPALSAEPGVLKVVSPKVEGEQQEDTVLPQDCGAEKEKI